ncbi:3-oxoacyl-ACP synthase [Tenacibaculum holothuriorum]|uniref:3-oxoacyl-ACP synthase n=1 Tax=Tenacibaculum holothuriorum TaxID=1635173 RepID=A0A1Y2PGZ0_9FLAO|nr:GreA/GreB family elongation factor [Tenacibaculum holothuriorum]OSY88979.1 3-oxoacyl-ACP synthase [Tenacibaculum holothuriorum]
MSLKEKLYLQCLEFVNKRLATVEATISSNQKALESETKSSAGDKHETGRAMLQLEMEKASQQLVGIQQMKETLAKINASEENRIACLGSIITTTSHNYFLSISAGNLNVDKKNYFAISPASPIGRQLLGKKTGEQFLFNGKEFSIVAIH